MYKSVLTLILSFIVLSNYQGFTQADFIADTTRGCDQLSVIFTSVNVTSSDAPQWNFGNGQTSSDINPGPILYDTLGSFTVTLELTDTIITKENFIQVYAPPFPKYLIKDTLSPASYSFYFSIPAQPEDTLTYFYDWRIDGGVTYNTPSFIHTFPSYGTYGVVLILTNEAGCRVSFARDIYVEEILEAPNVFTPNDDRYNQVFVIPVNGTSSYSLKIFSRNGILVYETESNYPTWDGTMTSGVDASPGIYYYILKPLDGKEYLKPQKGFVYLYR